MTYENVLTALADPRRRAIFEDLRAGPMPVVRLAARHPVSRPAVSQHLKVLETAGLVRSDPRGASRLYSIRPDGLAPLRAYLDTMWGDVLQAFANDITQAMESPDADRKDPTRGKDD